MRRRAGGVIVVGAMRCPLCKAPLTERDRRCPRCDALLERLPFTSLNLVESPADIPDPVSPDVADTSSTKADLGGDARIVGELGGDFASWSGSGEWTPHEDVFHGLTAEDYLGASTGVVERTFVPPATQVYVDETVARQLRPEAVLSIVPGDDSVLSPFERHVASFLDGSRPLARVARKANLSLDDARIALALLLDRKRAVLVGHLLVPERFQPKTRAAPTAPAAATAPAAPAQPRRQPPPLPPDAALDEPAAVRPPMRPSPKPAPPPTTPMRAPPPAAAPPATPFRPFDPARKPPPPGARYGAQQDVRLLKLAMQKEEAGLYDDAVRLLQKAIEVNPEAAVLYNRLGVVLATRKRDYTAAAAALFKACELEPNNDTYMSNLAKVAERSEAERAEEAATRASFGGLFRRRK